MKDNYHKICSENRQLNALFTRQQKDKEKRRARDKALKEATDKARVEEEECQAVRDKYDKRRQQYMQFEQFLDYKRNKSDTSYLKTSRAFDVLIHSGKPNSVG